MVSAPLVRHMCTLSNSILHEFPTDSIVSQINTFFTADMDDVQPIHRKRSATWHAPPIPRPPQVGGRTETTAGVEISRSRIALNEAAYKRTNTVVFMCVSRDRN